MWLLPLDFRAKAHTDLPPGRYLVPWYLPPSAVSRVAGLLGYLVEGVEHRVELPWGALPLPAPPLERPAEAPPRGSEPISNNRVFHRQSRARGLGRDEPGATLAE